ncbi:MAG: carbohydrate-binding protein [Phycisphaerae bacterium]|nr:carbohydrate-binding protein [Phycisphaerae bacterium]
MKHLLILVVSLSVLPLVQGGPSTVLGDYKGTPFQDFVYKAGAQSIPGILQCALYDLGGEGVAYHDTDAINHGSGELNVQPNHQRPHAGPYIWGFRKDEGMDLSYVKDFADLNHPNAVNPPVNLFYIGWTADGEWCSYTVDVKAAGTYKIRALYSNQANTITFDINRKPAATCKLPVATESFHTWDYAEIGTITFPQAGRQLLTFHYNTGNNFAFFEFEKVEPKGM